MPNAKTKASSTQATTTVRTRKSSLELAQERLAYAQAQDEKRQERLRHQAQVALVAAQAAHDKVVESVRSQREALSDRLAKSLAKSLTRLEAAEAAVATFAQPELFEAEDAE